MFNQKIEAVITHLKAPLTADEQSDGWTRQLKDGYVPYFEDLLVSVQDGKPIAYSALVRSLDAWGIGEGHLYRAMMEVANEVNANLA